MSSGIIGGGAPSGKVGGCSFGVADGGSAAECSVVTGSGGGGPSGKLGGGSFGVADDGCSV